MRNVLIKEHSMAATSIWQFCKLDATDTFQSVQKRIEVWYPAIIFFSYPALLPLTTKHYCMLALKQWSSNEAAVTQDVLQIITKHPSYHLINPCSSCCMSHELVISGKIKQCAQLLNQHEMLSRHGCQNRKRATKFPHNNFLTLVQVCGLHHSLAAAHLPSSQSLQLFH